MLALSLTKVGPEERVLQHSAKSGFVKVPCKMLEKLTAELGIPKPHNNELNKKEPFNSPAHIIKLMRKVLGPDTSEKKLLRIMKQTWGKSHLDPGSNDILQTLGAMDIMDKEDWKMFEDEAEVDWLQDAWLLNRRIKVTRLRCDAEGNRRSLRVMIRRVEVCGLLLIK